MEIITKSSQETFALGQKIGSSLIGGETLALSGNLGAGKTTFVQGLAMGLGIKSKIVSPTFILMRSYKANKFNLYHVDLYRLEGDIKKEVTNLGLTEAWERKENIVVIEWAEKIKDMLPSGTRWIKFKALESGDHEVIY